MASKKPAKKTTKPVAEKRPVGRPSDYTQEIGDQICARISDGQSLRTICKDDAMPSIVTIYSWLRQFPEFLKQYELAKEDQADSMAEEILEIADDGSNDYMEKFDKDGKSLGYFINGEHVQRSRLRVDSRKWIASKLKPKKYGDKLSQELTGKDGAPLVPDITDEKALARRVAFLLTQAKK